MNYLVWAALLPAVALLVIIYRQDKIEKEPIGLLIRLVFFGALTCISAMIFETVGEYILDFIGVQADTELYYLLDSFLVVAVSEEAGKYFVQKKMTWKHRAFNYRFDAIVYAVCVGLGFAMLENVLYVLEEGFGTAIIRAVTAIPSHAFDAVFMGYYFGEAKLAEAYGMEAKRKKYLKAAFIVPVLMHGFYDYCAFSQMDISNIVFFVFIIVMYVKAIKRVKKSAKEDRMVSY